MAKRKTMEAMRASGGKEIAAVARLVVLDGPGRGRKYKIAERAIIGRSSTCDVIIDDGEVSRRHAQIVSADEGFVIEDLGSRNGTVVNGVPVERGPLAIGDKIQLSERVILVLANYDPTEQEILQRQRLETLGRLAAGLAHDFNNMQAVITAGLDFVSSIPDDVTLADDRVRATLADMMRASDRASELARSLMSYARSDVDGFASVDLSTLCEEVLNFARRTFRRHVSIEAEIEADLRVIGSAAELHQLLMNLCVNANDAMPDGGTLTLTAQKVDIDSLVGAEAPASDEAVLIEVRDTGVGMDEATRKRIFEPFYSTKGRAGFGLGLATVKEIVTAHGATMEIESSPGSGTAFRVAFAAAPPARTRRAESKPPPSGDVPRLPRGTSVLVADDQEMVRRTMQRILEEAGATVLLAEDGDEAVALYASRARRPDLVIMDLDMPNASGEEALMSLRELDPHVRVVMVSGHHEEERERRARALGVMSFLRKPFDSLELMAASLGALHDELSADEELTGLGRRVSKEV
ncbi:MAG TPA: response regulator [Polyangiaceae bacterium]|nr:response regulator [Polyangiaceae bacterium]